MLNKTEFAATGTIKAMNPYLGTEIDLSGGFNITDGVICKLGYSHLIGTETMVALKGGNKDAVSNWGYVMLVLKPVLFEQKN